MRILFSSSLSEILLIQLILIIGIFLQPIVRWVWHIPVSKRLNVIVLYGVVGVDIGAILFIILSNLFRSSLQTMVFAFGFAFIWVSPGLGYWLYTIRKRKKSMRRKYYEALERINSR